MIPDKELEVLRKKVLESKRPLFFFDDDADGLASFVLLYKMVGDGKGVCVKGKPVLEEKYLRKVEEFLPDKIFVLDKPMVEQEFLDNVSVEVVWLDHHPVQDNKGVSYFNPLKHDPADSRPTSYWAYQVAKDHVRNPLWIAMIGIVGDWSFELADLFRKAYPGLLPASIKKPDEALFSSELGRLVRIVNFNLMGSTSEVMKSIKIITRIDDPSEILSQTSPKGKFLYKKYLSVNEEYQKLKSQVEVGDGKMVFFKYKDSRLAVSGELSNELLYLHPGKVIVIAREKSDEFVMSIRSSTINVSKILEEALSGVDGYGGGHDFSCGACVKKKDFDVFLEKFSSLVDGKP